MAAIKFWQPHFFEDAMHPINHVFWYHPVFSCIPGFLTGLNNQPEVKISSRAGLTVGN